MISFLSGGEKGHSIGPWMSTFAARQHKISQKRERERAVNFLEALTSQITSCIPLFVLASVLLEVLPGLT